MHHAAATATGHTQLSAWAWIMPVRTVVYVLSLLLQLLLTASYGCIRD